MKIIKTVKKYKLLQSFFLANDRWVFFLALGLNLLFYFNLIQFDPILKMRDDLLILNPLLKVNSIFDYWNLIFTFEKADVQPLVDLSYFLDIFLKKLFDLSTFHFSNFMYWLLCLFFIKKLIYGIFPKKITARIVFLLVSVHPVAAMSVGWIAARKHILGLLFLILSQLTFREWIKNRTKRNLFKFYLMYFFLLSTHLLYTFWIIVPLFTLLIEKGKKAWFYLKYFLLPILMFLAWNGFNYFRYMNYYKFLKHEDAIKSFEILNIPNFVAIFSSVGRYIFNLITPFGLAIEYSKFGIESLLGLILISMTLLFCYKRMTKEHLSWLFYFLFPIIFVAWKVPILVIDTYLLWPLVGYSILLGFLINNLKTTTQYVTSIVLLLIFIPSSFMTANAWISEEDLFRFSYKSEKNCVVLAELSKILISKKKLDEFSSIGETYILDKCQTNYTYLIMDHFYAISPKMKLEERVKYFNEKAWKFPLSDQFFLSAIYLDSEQDENALKSLKKSQELSHVEFQNLSSSVPYYLINQICSQKNYKTCVYFENLKL